MIRIWDLENKDVVAELLPPASKKGVAPECLSVAWSADGSTLFAGFSDNVIRVYGVHDN